MARSRLPSIKARSRVDISRVQTQSPKFRLQYSVPHFGGVNNFLDPASIDDGDSPDALNFVMDSVGAIKTRNGYTKLLTTPVGGAIQGLFSAYKSDGVTSQIVYAANRGFFRYNNAGGSTQINNSSGSAWVFSANASQYFMDIYQDRVHIVNGFDNPAYYDFTQVNPVGNVDIGGITYANGLTPNFVRVRKNRVYYAQGSVLYFSDAGNDQSWPVNNFIAINTNDGQQVSGMENLLDALNIFKTESIWILTGDPLGVGNTTTIGNLSLRQANSAVGCSAPRTIKNVEGVIFFMHRSGIYILENYTSRLISQDINNTFLNDLNLNKINTCWAVYNPTQKKYILGYPSASSSVPNKAMVFDLMTEKWELWDHIPGSVATNFNFNSSVVTIMGDPSKGNIYEMFQGYADIAGDNGTSSGSNSSTTLNDTSKSWTTNQFVDCQVKITAGTGAGQTAIVTANSATQLTISPAWVTTPDATSVYTIGYINFYWKSKIYDFMQPELTKKYKYLNLFADAETGYNLNVGTGLDFQIPQATITLPLSNGAGSWGSGTWGSGTWGSAASQFFQAAVSGTGHWVQAIFSNSNANQPVRIFRYGFTYKTKRARPTKAI